MNFTIFVDRKVSDPFALFLFHGGWSGKIISSKSIIPSWALFFFFPIFLLISGCDQAPQGNEYYADVPPESMEKGRLLAQQHCATCHPFPDPAQLDAKTWANAALPAMGPMMGIFSYQGVNYQYRGDPHMKGPGFLAGNPVVTPEEWGHIFNYYTASAPTRLQPQEKKEEISLDLSRFQFISPGLSYRNSRSSLVKVFNNARSRVVVSDAQTLTTYFLNAELETVDSLKSDGPLVNIDFTGDQEAIACNVGIMEPNDGALGSASRIQEKQGHWEEQDTNLFTGLHRPMQIQAADLNDDERTDYLLAEFGYMQGGLSWMESQADGRFQKHTISNLAGASKAYPLDFDRDGKMDVIALFAQGKEVINLYRNLGNDQFEEIELLSFPSLYGSSHFEFADFNQDGKPDILYTAGDNADYTSILKPYHGVYIFLNKGGYEFEQAFFYPIYGCYKAMAHDFDQDGDLDISTIAYYADFASQPEEGFVYLENEGDLQFNPQSATELQIGRWITMDIGDIDQDGWTDIILGNFVQPSSYANPSVNWAEAPPVLVLKNKGD